MKTYLFILLLFITTTTQAEFKVFDRYCSKQVDHLRLFFVNGMFTTPDDFRKNLAWLDYFQNTKLRNYQKGIPPTGSYNQNENLSKQIYEIAQQKYADLPIFSKKYNVIKAILGGNLGSLSTEEVEMVEAVLQEVFSAVDFKRLDDTDYRNAYQKLLFQLHSCNRIILIGHSQGNYYTNSLFDEILSNYQYSDGYLASDYPMVGLASIATPTSSLGGNLGDEYRHLISHLTLEQDQIMRVVRILFGSMPSNFSMSSLFDYTGHSLIDSYIRNTPVANQISDGIKQSISNQVPFPLFEQHPVSSTAFSHIGYSTINNVLDLKFKSGSVYRYYEVPIPVWESFYYSTSMGEFFNENIRGQYRAGKLEIESMEFMTFTSNEPIASVHK